MTLNCVMAVMLRYFAELGSFGGRDYTRNSSGDEIANMNFLTDDIVHTLQNTIDSYINSATDRRRYVLERRLTKVIEIAMQRPLRRSRSLVKFFLARRVCFTLTLSRVWLFANIAINDISLTTRFFGLHFRCRKYWCIFNHFYVIRPES